MPGSAPAEFSLAAVTGGTGIITAAKPSDVQPGALILRVYQPTNAQQAIGIELGRGKPATVALVTALEDPVEDGTGASVAITDAGFGLQAATALNTVQITW